MKQEVGYTEVDDCTFWMQLSDFKRYFKWIHVCKISEDNSHTYVECPNKAGIPGAYTLQKMKVRGISGPQPMTLTLQQKDKRCFPRDTTYDYCYARMILLRLKLKLEYVKGVCGKMRDLHMELDEIEPGEYYVFVELDQASPLNVSDFALTTYTSARIEFHGDESSYFPRLQILTDAFKSKALIGHQSVTLEQRDVNGLELKSATKYPVQKYSDFSGDDGYAFIYFANGMNGKNYTENCVFKRFEGLKMLPPFSGNSYEVELPPNSE